MKILLYLLPLTFAATFAQAQTGNYAASGEESSTFGPLSLGGNQTWTTARDASPGYFSAIGPDGAFTDAADGSYALVDGYVKFYAGAANQSFTFPVGVAGATAAQSDLRSVTISGSLPANAVVAAAWIAGDPSTTTDPTSTGAAAGSHPTTATGTGILSVNTAGMWDLQDIGGNAAGATITVSIPNVSTATADLRLVGWNGTQWVNLSAAQGNAAASGNTENSTLSGTLQAGITAIGIGAASTPLPVEWLSFTAAPRGSDVVLDWSTAREENSARFDIEYAFDNHTFYKFGEVAAAGNSSQVTTYQAIHHNAATLGKPLIHYRIRQVDKDGTAVYSETRQVWFRNKDNSVLVYPNPLERGAAVHVTARELNTIELYDNAGRLVWTQQYPQATATATVPTAALATGTYIIKVNKEHISKIVVR